MKPAAFWGLPQWNADTASGTTGVFAKGGAGNMTTAKDLIRELERTRDETVRYFSLSPADLARTYAPGKWSVRFILHHLADSETVSFDRIRRMISEPHQVVWAVDPDAWARGLDYAQLPLDLSNGVYQPVRAAIIHYASLHYERNGRLQSVHSETGVRTLREQFDDVASHNEHHLAQIRTALRGAG